MDSSGNSNSFLRRIFFAPTPLNFALFGFFWLMLGLSIGLNTLLGPVRWVVKLQINYPQTPWIEPLLVKVIIAVLAIFTAFLAAYFVRLFAKYKEKHLRFILSLFLLTSGLTAVVLILNPHKFKLFETQINVYNARFVFGGYPSEAQMEKLKLEGYAGIITLLNADIITEKPLLDKEKRLAKKVGIPLIELPILPWLDSPKNQESINQMITIAKSGEGRYYIHCYFGLDRTDIIQRAISKYSPSEEILSISSLKSIKAIRSFERGPVIKLQEDLYLIPFPTRDEMIGYVIDSEIKEVISTLDTNEIRAKKLVEQQKTLLETYFVPFQTMPLTLYPYDPEKILEMAREILNKPKPLILETFATESLEAEALTLSITTNLPSLPPRLFSFPMVKGVPHVILPNVAIGPTPTPREFGSYLFNRGIRKAIYVGPHNSLQEDAKFAKIAGLTWEEYPDYTDQLKNLLKKGGPYYLYGPNVQLEHQIVYHNALQNGAIVPLSIGVYQTPFPTSEEIQSLFPPSQIQKVIFLTTSEEEEEMIAQQKALSKSLGIKVSHYKIDRDNFVPKRVLAAAQEAWKSPFPIVIAIQPQNLFLQQAFKQAFFADVEPIPPALLTIPIQEGAIRNLAPNIVSGPAPQPNEFRDYFYFRGIRDFIFFGDRRSKTAKRDRQIATREGLSFTSAEPSSAFIYSKLGYKTTPVYVYTDKDNANLGEVNLAKQRIEKRLGPPIPPIPLVYPDLEPETFFEALTKQNTAGEKGFSWKGLTGRYLPDLKTTLLLSPLLIIYTLLSASVAIYMKSRGIGVPYTRKTFHFLIFTLAGVLQLSLQIPSVVLYGLLVSICVLYAVIRGQGFPFYEIMARPTDYPHEGYYIIMPLFMTALGGFLSYFFFGILMVVGIFSCGFGDAVGEVIGRKFGKHTYRTYSLGEIASIRSLEGSIAIYVVSFLAAFFSLYVLQYPTTPTLITSLLVAISVVFVEAFSSHGWDNLTVQLAASGTAFLCIHYLFQL